MCFVILSGGQIGKTSINQSDQPLSGICNAASHLGQKTALESSCFLFASPFYLLLFAVVIKKKEKLLDGTTERCLSPWSS